MGWYGLKGVQGQVHCLKPGQVTDHHETGYKLAYDGCQSGSGHSHVESKYKQGIQYGVDHSAGQGTHHRVPGASVRPDEIGAACGQDQEGKTKGCDPCIGKGIVQHVRCGAEQDHHGAQEQSDGQTQDDTDGKKHEDRVASIPLSLLPVPPPHGQVKIGGAADPAHQ